VGEAAVENKECKEWFHQLRGSGGVKTGPASVRWSSARRHLRYTSSLARWAREGGRGGVLSKGDRI